MPNGTILHIIETVLSNLNKYEKVTFIDKFNLSLDLQKANAVDVEILFSFFVISNKSIYKFIFFNLFKTTLLYVYLYKEKENLQRRTAVDNNISGFWTVDSTV